MFVAQQLIDASEDGGEAFLAFAIMVFLFTDSSTCPREHPDEVLQELGYSAQRIADLRVEGII